jgi:hypothetical protein
VCWDKKLRLHGLLVCFTIHGVFNGDISNRFVCSITGFVFTFNGHLVLLLNFRFAKYAVAATLTAKHAVAATLGLLSTL